MKRHVMRAVATSMATVLMVGGLSLTTLAEVPENGFGWEKLVSHFIAIGRFE